MIIIDSMKGKEDVTFDGRGIDVRCNVALPDEMPAGLGNDGRDIGLFRAEFFHLAADDYPTEEEQFQAYKRAASAMGGRRVIIRPLDIGTDKREGYFKTEKEKNPALGMRGIRICLKHPEIFIPQLRALYRASAHGKIAIMFPMITSLWELRECKQSCRRVMDELERKGVPFDRDVEIGIIIETPSSVFIADALAKEADFFLIGANNLIRYILACDRRMGELDRFFDPRHPAVKRALMMVVDAAHNAGIWVGVCGELCTDLELATESFDIGIDEISASPAFVSTLCAEIREPVVKSRMPESWNDDSC